MKYEISSNLMSLYIYINKLLILGQMNKDVKKLEEAKDLLTTIASGFEEIKSKKQENKKPLLDDSQTIYKGLTYKNGKLEEYSARSTGFKA